MDRRTVGTKDPGCCREVAVSGGSTVIFFNWVMPKILAFHRMHIFVPSGYPLVTCDQALLSFSPRKVKKRKRMPDRRLTPWDRCNITIKGHALYYFNPRGVLRYFSDHPEISNSQIANFKPPKCLRTSQSLIYLSALPPWTLIHVDLMRYHIMISDSVMPRQIPSSFNSFAVAK